MREETAIQKNDDVVMRNNKYSCNVLVIKSVLLDDRCEQWAMAPPKVVKIVGFYCFQCVGEHPDRETLYVIHRLPFSDNERFK